MLRPNELDHELLWLTVSIASVSGAALWFWLQLPWPVCLFRGTTGHHCVTCGGTTCFLALLRGDIATAFLANPAVFCGFFALGLYCCYAAVVLTFRLQRLRMEIESPAIANAVRWSVLAVLALNGLYEWRREL